MIASQDSSLLPIADLCDTFPLDASRAFLAYAESQSFVRFLRDSYGTPALFSLTSAYADGLSCDQGVMRTLGTSLASLDTRWRESVLGQNVVGVFLRNMLPYLGLFVFMLLIPLIGFFQRRPAEDGTRLRLVRVHVWVQGRVQAVGFRAFVQQNAVQLGVTGWVRNVGYNTVEAVAEGTRQQIEGFLRMVKRGPSVSRVDECREEWEQVTGEFEFFRVKASA